MSERLLRNISIIYLALPNFLFYSYWVNIPIAIVGSFTLLYLIVRDRLGRDYSLMTVLRGKDFILIPGFSLILTVVSGICGLTFQNIDYWAHNVKFYELMSYSWPLRFDGAVISYYFGYYAVPGLIFKMTGEINEVVIFVWTWFGLGLGIAWIYLVLNKKLVLVWIALCIGDFPRVVKALLSFFSIRLYEPEEFGIETWSNFENLLWVPNQLIPTLLIGGMLGYGLKNRLKIDLMVLPVALSFWWAVFPAFTGGLLVGLLVMINWFLFPRKQDIMQIFDRVVLPFLVCLPVLVFFLSHMASPESGFVWLFRADKINLAVEYLVNIGINATVFLSLYLLYKRAKLPILNPTPAYFIFFLLITLPFYRMGEVNDLLFRGMMTPLILIGLYLLHPISAQTIRENIIMMKKSPVTMILTILLFSSVFMSIGRLCRAIIHNPVIAETTFNKQPYHAIPYDLYDNVYEVLQVKWSQKGADQYHGNQESFYEKYMAPQ